jgi:hypothetical protein
MSENDDKKGWKVEKGLLKSFAITSLFSTK